MNAMWDERYGKPGFAYGTAPNDFLREHAHRLPAGPVLCLAEGEGRNATWLAQREDLEVHAVDGSEVGVRKTAELAAERGVTVRARHADLADLDLGEDCWAGIVAIWAHLPLPLRQRVHAAGVRALKPGGVLLLEAYTPRQLEHRTGGPPVLSMLCEPDDLRAELAGLHFERLEELEREVHEGPYHHGTSAVVQIVARKPVSKTGSDR